MWMDKVPLGYKGVIDTVSIIVDMEYLAWHYKTDFLCFFSCVKKLYGKNTPNCCPLKQLIFHTAEFVVT